MDEEIASMNVSSITEGSVCTAIEQCTGVAVVLYSPQGNVIRWSPAAEKLTGWSEAQAAGKPMSWSLAGPDATTTVDGWLARMGDRGWVEELVQHTRPDAPPLALRSLFSIVRQGDAVSGLAELMHDPSENAERDGTSALEAQERLLHAQKLESLGVMAGGIAHDFNNLLTAMLGNASLALRDLPFGHSSRPLVQNIQEAARRAARLTRELLAYSGRAKFEIRPIDLSSHVRDISPSRELLHLEKSRGSASSWPRDSLRLKPTSLNSSRS